MTSEVRVALHIECIYKSSKINGTIYIKLYRHAFPLGVTNFLGLITGNVMRTEELKPQMYSSNVSNDLFQSNNIVSTGIHHYKTKSYEGTRFFGQSQNEFLVGGDIYDNNGNNAGTIFGDKPFGYISANRIPNIDELTNDVATIELPINEKHTIILPPFYSEDDKITRKMPFYDSTFMITLGRNRFEPNSNMVAIGYVEIGGEILDKINELLKPEINKVYPVVTVTKCGIM